MGATGGLGALAKGFFAARSLEAAGGSEASLDLLAAGGLKAADGFDDAL